MLKKILVTIVLVGFFGVLIWGGINRTLAKTGENNASSLTRQGRNQEAGSVLSGSNEATESHGEGRGSGVQAAAQNHESELDMGGTQGGGWGGGSGQGGGGGQGGGRMPLEPEDVEALQMALEDEYHALATYQAVIDQFGAVEPFVEIARAEQQHIDALLSHFSKHNLPVPENPWLGNIPAFEDLQAACQTGVAAEIANAALYEQLLSVTDDPGLVHVFENLLRASQENHLPEFEACE